GNSAGGEGPLVALAAWQAQRAEAACCAGRRVGEGEVNRASAGLSQNSGDTDGAARSHGNIPWRERLQEARRQGKYRCRLDVGIGFEGGSHGDADAVGREVARGRVLALGIDRAGACGKVASGYGPGYVGHATAIEDGIELMDSAASGGA